MRAAKIIGSGCQSSVSCRANLRAICVGRTRCGVPNIRGLKRPGCWPGGRQQVQCDVPSQRSREARR